MWPENSYDTILASYSRAEKGASRQTNTYTADDGIELAVEFLLVGVGNGPDLVVASVAQNAANQNLVGSHLALGRPVDVHDILLHLLRNDRG